TAGNSARRWPPGSKPGSSDAMSITWDRPAALAALEAGYDELFARLAGAGAADERVRGMWLSGSIARGDADIASDLDVLLAISDDGFDAFAAGCRDWIAAITPTLIAQPLPFAPACFTCVTPARLRFDLVSERVSDLPRTIFPTRALVFDRDGLA